MQTKKSNHDFRILSGMVMSLGLEQRSDLLNYLVGYLWRDEELYEGAAKWLKDKEKNEVPVPSV